MTCYVSLLGLGFGDCGKGLFVDHLCRRWSAHTVVRFNGGAQAGHNVVLADARQHTFSQFGAGSFQPQVVSVLASPVVVHPTALVIEQQALQRVGVKDGLERLLIDARCRVTTPFHQAAGRLREWLRCTAAHGSCGVGVGETVRHALAEPASALRYGELTDSVLTLDRLEAIRIGLLREFAAHPPLHDGWRREYALLDDPQVARRWLETARPCIERAPPATVETIAAQLTRPGVVLFEGAQGVLLDETRGFHPHTTWSTISTEAVDAVLADAGIADRARHLGVMRSYLTRHGAGPLPTFDPALDGLPEPHNSDSGWQGRFRRGQPDAVLLRYALKAVGPLDGLLVSHLDAFDRIGGLRWCEAYRFAGSASALSDLPWSGSPDLAHQARLTDLVQQAVPVYRADAVTTPRQWIENTEATAGLTVLMGSFGPAASQVRLLADDFAMP